MSAWARLRLYAALAAGAAALLVAVGSGVGGGLTLTLSNLTWTGIVVLPLYVVAVWLVWHRPDHVQARRVLFIATASAVAAALEGLVRHYSLFASGVWLWVANFAHLYVSLAAAVWGGALLASYPDGDTERRWQRRVVTCLWWSMALPPLLLVTRHDLVVSTYLFDSAPAPVASPFAVTWLAPLGAPLKALLDSSAPALLGAGVLLIRFVRASGEKRLRMRPLVYTIFALVPLIGAIALLLALDVPEDSPWFAFVSALVMPVLLMVPVSIAVSVLRHGLFDIDIVLRRSVVYGVLTVGIALVYVVLAAAPGLALGNQIPVQLAVILTVIAALAFHPLRRRVEALADRWVFGKRVNRYQLLTSFGTTLEQSVDLTDLLPRLADTVERGLSASWVRVSLRGNQDSWLSEPVGTAGKPNGPAVLTERLRHHEEVVGRIECGPRSGGYDPADRELLTILAGQAATAIANVRLTASLGEQVAELARSRARIVAAQDTERRRIERDIHDGVQQGAVALITKLRLARNRLERGESTDALLVEMQADASEFLTDLRELAHGIHPPVLTDGGLVAAVEARAGRLPLGVTVRANEVRGQRFHPDVEAAAYFVVCEALTNVVKHAAATDAVVSLTAENGQLSLRVCDNGSGLNGTGTHGQGLTNLRDRVEALGGHLRVECGAGGGTILSTELPIGADGA